MFRRSVKSTGYPLHSPVSRLLPLSCVTVCHHVSTGVYLLRATVKQTPQNKQPSGKSGTGRKVRQKNNFIYISALLWDFTQRRTAESYTRFELSGTIFKGQAAEAWNQPGLTFWRRNYFFLILAHSVYKMWIIQEPNKLILWNKLHFKEKKTESIHHV